MVPFSSPQTFKRFNPGTYHDGELMPMTHYEVTVNCCIQPFARGRGDQAEIIVPREGGRWVNGFIAIDSEEELKTDSTLTWGDQVVYQGAIYEVIQANNWPFLSVAHWECYAQRIDPNTNTYDSN